jgi:predicted amidophosphoribosyltransferase
MFTNITQRISGLINLFFPKKNKVQSNNPQKSTSRYALYIYTSVKKEILSLKHAKFTYITNIFAKYLYSKTLHTPTPLIYVPSTTYAARVKQVDHMKEFVLQYEPLLSPVYTICIDSIQITHTHIQHSLNRKLRFKYSKDKFCITPQFIEYISTQNITHLVCIDDVTTTGATRIAITKLFEPYNIYVEFIAIASQD